MTVADIGVVGRAARWLLLFCTLVGLAVMHTVGHTAPVPAAGSPAVAPSVAVFAEAADPCPDGHCDGHGGHGGMSGWSVCLAILGGLAAIALLTVLLLSGRRGRRHDPGAAPPMSRAPRAPPLRAVGLTIASGAVLRV